MSHPPNTPPSEGLAGTTFFARTYKETLVLAEEARNYLAASLAPGSPQATAAERLARVNESMRLTARLTQTMAWLLAHRALHSGELSIEAARARGDLADGHPICLESGDTTGLPRGLASLLDRSEGLYRRVRRLNELLDRA